MKSDNVELLKDDITSRIKFLQTKPVAGDSVIKISELTLVLFRIQELELSEVLEKKAKEK